MKWIWFIAALISGVLAFKVGKWRHVCVLNSRDSDTRANLPLGWGNPFIRFGTWWLWFALIGFFACVWAYPLNAYFTNLTYETCLGMLIVVCWSASNLAAYPIHWASSSRYIEHKSELEKCFQAGMEAGSAASHGYSRWHRAPPPPHKR